MKQQITKLMSLAASLLVMASVGIQTVSAKSHQRQPDAKQQAIANHLKGSAGSASTKIFGRRAPQFVYVVPFTLDPSLSQSVFVESVHKFNRVAINAQNAGTTFLTSAGALYQGIQGAYLTSLSYDLSTDSDLTDDLSYILVGADLSGGIYLHFADQDDWDLSGTSGPGWVTFFYNANDAFWPSYPQVSGEVASDLVLQVDGFFQADNVWLSNFQINGYRLRQQLQAIHISGLSLKLISGVDLEIAN